MDADGFTVVGRGHRKKAHPSKDQRHVRRVGADVSSNCLSRKEIVDRIKKCVELLESSSWCSDVMKLVHVKNAHLSCLGIGCVGRSEIARLQCAFGLVLQQRCGCPEVPPLFIEPLLTEVERDAVADVGFVLTDSSNVSSEQRLFYMPHCPAGLYHKVLLDHWKADILFNVCIIGNSFANYFVRLAPGKAPLIAKTESFLNETALPNTLSEGKLAFNDTSIHTFRIVSHLPLVTEEDISYKDPEVITSLPN